MSLFFIHFYFNYNCYVFHSTSIIIQQRNQLMNESFIQNAGHVIFGQSIIKRGIIRTVNVVIRTSFLLILQLQFEQKGIYCQTWKWITVSEAKLTEYLASNNLLSYPSPRRIAHMQCPSGPQLSLHLVRLKTECLLTKLFVILQRYGVNYSDMPILSFLPPSLSGFLASHSSFTMSSFQLRVYHKLTENEQPV